MMKPLAVIHRDLLLIDANHHLSINTKIAGLNTMLAVIEYRTYYKVILLLYRFV
jgi:hypothetical protein